MKTLHAAVIAMVLSCFVHAADAGGLRMGILPVLDTLPLQVAVHDGLFTDAGLEVELVPFSSALERDTAMQTGRLDGYFGDLQATLLLVKSGVPLRVVTTSYHTMEDQRMFALLAGPSVTEDDPRAIENVKVGLSKATIIEYLLDRMIHTDGLPASGWERTEVKKIPLRLQMLLSGRLDLALLPEPLVTLAEGRGARVLTTDAGLDMPLTVLCLHEAKLGNDGKVLHAFLAAYREAVDRVNRQPEQYRDLMASTCRIPDPLVGGFPIPHYPKPGLPSEDDINDVQTWMMKKSMLTEPIPYSRLLPAAAGGAAP